MIDRTARATIEAYTAQRDRALNRNVPWHFTLSSWCDLWELSGRWHQRGKGPKQYCMARFNDVGPYADDNVEIITNSKDRCTNTPPVNHTVYCGQKRCKQFYKFEGVRFDKQADLAKAFNRSIRWVQKKVAEGYFEKWQTIPAMKRYSTPIGDFYQMKDVLREVRDHYRRDLTRQAIWYRFQNPNYPEFYITDLPEMSYRVI